MGTKEGGNANLPTADGRDEDKQPRLETEIPEEILAWRQEEEEALKKDLPKGKISRPGKIALAMFCLTGVAAGAYHFIQNYQEEQREMLDEAGVPALQAQDEKGKDLTRDDILQSLANRDNPFYAQDILASPKVLDGKTWQKVAVLESAKNVGIYAIQYCDSFFPYLTDQEKADLINGWAKENPAYFLENFAKLKKFPAAEKALPVAILAVAKDKNGALLNYVELVRTLPEGNEIIFGLLAKLSPEQVIHYANKLKGEPRAEKIVELNFRYLLEKNSEWLLNNAVNYNQYANADEILQKAVEKLTNSYSPQVIFENFKQLADRPWIVEKLHKLLDRNLGLLIQNVQYYQNLPGGQKLFLQAYNEAKVRAHNENARDRYSLPLLSSHDWDCIIASYDNYKSLPGADELLEQAFRSAMMNLSKYVVLENLPKFYGRPWAKKMLKEIIEKSPKDFLERFSDYQNLPDAESLFNQAVGKLKQEQYLYLPSNLELLFLYPSGVELIKSYAEKDSFDTLYSYEKLLKYPEGKEILKQCLSYSVKKEPDRFFEVFRSRKDFLSNSWVREWFLSNVEQLSLPVFSLMLNNEKDWQENIEIIKKIVSKSPPRDVLNFVGLIYAADRAWAVSILPGIIKAASKNDQLFYIYTLISLKEPALKEVLLEVAKSVTDKNILFYWQYFKQLDPEWAKGLVLQRLPSLTIQEILFNIHTIFEVDAEFGKKIIEEKMADNYALALTYFYQYRLELPNANEIFLHSAKMALELNPVLVVQAGKKLQEVVGGQEILLAALKKLVASDPKAVFVNFEQWVNLPMESVRPLIRLATINDPGWALTALSQSNDLANLLRSILATDQDPQIVKLLAWDKEADDSRLKEIGAILLFNGQEKSVEEIKTIVKDEKLLFLSLVKIMSSPNATAKASADRELGNLALRQVRTVNNLHESPDEKRFKLAEGLSATELYTLMVYGEQEEFTSTYNGFFNRLLDKLEAEKLSPTVLLEQTGYNKFRAFVKLATQFNRLPEFLDLMDGPSQQDLLGSFVRDIEKSPEFLAESVSVADTFSVIQDPELLKILQQEVKQEYERVVAQNHREGIAVYGLLAGMFSEKAVINEEWIKTMAEKYHLPDIVGISIDKLEKDGRIIQQYSFYDDPDGKASFQNFLAGYQNDEKWQVNNFKDYVQIVSVGTAKRVEIYANKPESGIWAVTDLLKKEKLQPTVLVHRGHSYHATETIPLVAEYTKLVSLGSCGGYGLIDPVLEKSKGAHIISTKGTGTMTVNDPLLKMLNQEIAAGHNINWSAFWAKAEERLGSNRYFKDYVAPNKNLGVLFLKAYREQVQNDVYEGKTN